MPAGVHGWLLFWFVVLVSICGMSLAALCLIGLGAAARWLHEHRHQGQVLRHSHRDGDRDHGYYEHPEDGA